MKRTIMTAATLAIMASGANAKEWKSEVVKLDNGKLTIIETVASCNYARTVSQARKVAEKHEGAFFNLIGTDNQMTCPKKSRKPKDETTNAN